MNAVLACVLLLVFAALPGAGMACDRPVCLADTPLRLSQIVTFDDQPSGMGPGRRIDGILDLPGASFGERFAGQSLSAQHSYDLVTGVAAAPLSLLAGREGRNLSMLRLAGTNALSGDGPAGFPRVEATGEGAIAMLFARDQAAVRIALRGGEGGVVVILFMARDGRIIDSHTLGPLAEDIFEFTRRDAQDDIAGLVLSNRDPEGIALDEVAFDFGFETSAVGHYLRSAASVPPFPRDICALYPRHVCKTS